MKIEQNTLDTVLGFYIPECRFLVEAELEYPRAKGVFRIPGTFYGNNVDLSHFTAIEMFFCYNQLGYAFFAESGRLGLIDEVGEIPLEQFRKLQAENFFITRIDNVRFRKPIDIGEEFNGRIRLNEVVSKRNGKLCFFKTEYDFEGKATGEVDFALVR